MIATVATSEARSGARHWPSASERLEELLLAFLAARTSMERMLAGGVLLDAGFGTEWLVDDACGSRSVLVERFLGHVVRTESAHHARVLAEGGAPAPLHTAALLRHVTGQELATRRWWSQLDMTEGGPS